MVDKILYIFLLLFLTACGSSKSEQASDVDALSVQTLTIAEIKNDTNSTEIKANEEQNIVKAAKSVIIYVHGYNKDGSNNGEVYGSIKNDAAIINLADFTDFPTIENYEDNDTNVIASTSYYGNKSPVYYTQKDVDDIASITKEYGGGIPRYAMIIAKFAKHIMKESGAEELHIVSASMGSLVTRWLIEKDIEHLASQKKIKKWLSIEGVIRGNYAASNTSLMQIVNKVVKQPIDAEHMNYDWVNKHLSGSNATSVNFKDIDMGFISSTYDKNGVLSKFLIVNGQAQANDGVQLLRDTVFVSTPNHTPTYTHFHQFHQDIKKDKGAWAQVATFLTSKRRVKITLTQAKISDLHEDINFLNKRAEIVFSSHVISPKVDEKYNITEEISERVLQGGSLKLTKFETINENKTINQIIFNDYVLDGERELQVKISAHELDIFPIYGVYEISEGNKVSDLGQVKLNIPLKNDTFEIEGKDWSATLKVEFI